MDANGEKLKPPQLGGCTSDNESMMSRLSTAYPLLGASHNSALKGGSQGNYSHSPGQNPLRAFPKPLTKAVSFNRIRRPTDPTPSLHPESQTFGASHCNADLLLCSVRKHGEQSFKSTSRGTAVELTQVELMNFEKMFRTFDVDNSGTIDIHEIGALMRGLGCPMSEAELEKLVGAVDKNGSKELEKDEFLALMRTFKKIKGEMELMATADRDKRIGAAQYSSLPRYAILEEAPWKWWWDVVILLVTWYYCIVASPVVWVLDDFPFPPIVRICVEWCLTAILLADMVLRSLTIDSATRSEIVMNSANVHHFTIVGCYVRSKRFAPDLLSSLPLDLVFFHLGMMMNWRICYHLRILRLFTYHMLWGGGNGLSQISISFIKFHFNYIPMLKLCFWTVVIVHWLTSLWLLVNYSSDATWSNPKLNQYHTALYWVLYTLTGTGYGDIDITEKQQYWFACVCISIGAILNAIMIGKLTGELLRPNVATSGHSRLRMTLEVLQFLHIPKDLQEDILSFLAHTFESDVQAFDDLFDALPGPLRGSLELHLKIKSLSSVSLFSIAHPECKIELARRLRSEVYSPDQFIVVAGQAPEGLFVLSHGFCDVIQPSKGEHTTIRKGDYFGERELLTARPFEISIKTLTYTELFQLTMEDFRSILRNFPGFAEEVKRIQKELENPHLPGNRPPNQRPSAMSFSFENFDNINASPVLSTISHGLSQAPSDPPAIEELLACPRPVYPERQTSTGMDRSIRSDGRLSGMFGFSLGVNPLQPRRRQKTSAAGHSPRDDETRNLEELGGKIDRLESAVMMQMNTINQLLKASDHSLQPQVPTNLRKKSSASDANTGPKKASLSHLFTDSLEADLTPPVQQHHLGVSPRRVRRGVPDEDPLHDPARADEAVSLHKLLKDIELTRDNAGREKEVKEREMRSLRPEVSAGESAFGRDVFKEGSGARLFGVLASPATEDEHAFRRKPSLSTSLPSLGRQESEHAVATARDSGSWVGSEQ
eukprot:Sspe_Gene.87243::Locus_58297_Transcript_1_1_Confidence_1.000_Length_3253::g.87243::m.87243